MTNKTSKDEYRYLELFHNNKTPSLLKGSTNPIKINPQAL